MPPRSLLTEPPIELEGLVDPSVSPKTAIVPPISIPAGLKVPCVAWAKMTGFSPAWTPALVSYIYKDGECAVFFLSKALFPSDKENSSNKKQKPNVKEKVPSWFAASESLRVTSSEHPVGPVQFAFIPLANVRPWDAHSPHHEQFMAQLTASSKIRVYTDSIRLANSLSTDSAAYWPPFFLKDHRLRSEVESHSFEQSEIVAHSVRPCLRLHHLKLFIETNLLELHWRTIPHARQFVKAVEDEIFGGYHLIAAQDWPTDRDVASGIGNVFLVYPGNILSHEEAHTTHSGGDVHSDTNRYVAEIPNTVEIFDKGKKNNLNHTGNNLFVDGLKYADPRSPLWAPGPTVNHERVQYCKLEPHHVDNTDTSGLMRGFWLQRKKGAVIYKGEPLFWSYDCGAGKFDEDFHLTSTTPPPIGWRPNPKKGNN